MAFKARNMLHIQVDGSGPSMTGQSSQYQKENPLLSIMNPIYRPIYARIKNSTTRRTITNTAKAPPGMSDSADNSITEVIIQYGDRPFFFCSSSVLCIHLRG